MSAKAKPRKPPKVGERPDVEIDLDSIQPPPIEEAARDDKAQKEGVVFGDAWRDENRKAEGHRIFIYLLRFAAGFVALMLLVRILHFILPANTAENQCLPVHCWLTDSQLDGIDTYFLSATIGALMLRYSSSVLPESKNK